eukprot:14150220-Alexandrium_andersonii.AAC.1
MGVCRTAWQEFARAVGPEFFAKATGGGAERLASGPRTVARGTWVAAADSPEGRRLTDVVCIFRSMRNAQTDGRFDALNRTVRVTHTCPRCEKAYPA